MKRINRELLDQLKMTTDTPIGMKAGSEEGEPLSLYDSMSQDKKGNDQEDSDAYAIIGSYINGRRPQDPIQSAQPLKKRG